MRRRWPWSLAGLALIGALLSGGAPAFAETGTPAAGASPVASACVEASDAELARIARLWHEEVYAAKDPSRLDPYLAPDLVHHAAAFPDVSGPDALKRIFASVIAGFPDVQGRVNLVLVDAPYVVTEWTVSGTNLGTFQGRAPTGKPATWEGINIYRFACGKIVETWSELDQLGRLQQLGLSPLAAAATPAIAVASPAPAASPAACPAPTREEGAALVRRWWDDVWTAGKTDALGEIVADGVVHHWALGPDTSGVDAIADRVARWRTTFPDLTIRYGHLVQDGDFVAATWTLRGTHQGAFMDIAPTGKSVEFTGINIFRIECGRIAETWSEMDAVGLLRQVGAMPATATPGP